MDKGCKEIPWEGREIFASYGSFSQRLEKAPYQKVAVPDLFSVTN